MKTILQNRWTNPGLALLLSGVLSATLLTTACGDDSGTPDTDAEAQDGTTGDASTVDAGPGPVDCDEFVCPETCTVYVDHTAVSGGDGTSPELAIRRVQDGIAQATALAGPCCRCDVWVAEGSYYVRVASPQETIQLVERVDVYGGYPEGFAGDRDPAAHPTVLSGRAAWDADLHVYHVVTGADDCRLDGFVIEGGRAQLDDNELITDNYGAGMLNLGVSPRVDNCVFRDNQALNGGAVYNLDSQARFQHCRFEENLATHRGGALLNRRSPVLLRHAQVLANEATDGAGLFNSATSDATLINCVVAGNVATGAGGGLRNEASSPLLIHVSLGENVAATGGGVYNNEGSSPHIVNSILHRDEPDEVVNVDAGSTPHVTYTNVMGGCTVASGCTTEETGNLDVNPL